MIAQTVYKREARLTPRRLEVLQVIARLQDESGRNPSIHEINIALGNSSGAALHTAMEGLQRLGLIARERYEARSTQITPEGRNVLIKAARGDVLGARALRILGYVAAYQAEHGYSPSTRDIAQHLGLNTIGAALYSVDKLIESGHLAQTYYVPRSLRLTGKGLSALRSSPEVLP